MAQRRGPGKPAERTDCEQRELASERPYSAFAEVHASHPTVAQLRRKTAREKLQHAAQFRLLMGA